MNNKILGDIVIFITMFIFVLGFFALSQESTIGLTIYELVNEENQSNGTIELIYGGVTTVTKLNKTIEENLTQVNIRNDITGFTIIEDKAVEQVLIGQPVRWIKKIIPKEEDVSLEIPINASDIKIKKRLKNIVSDVKNVRVDEETKINLITGFSVAEFGKGFITEFFNKIFITGLAVYEYVNEKSLERSGEKAEDTFDRFEAKETKKLIIEEIADELEIEYTLPGPEVIENEDNGNRHITISSDIHYENILAFTNIQESKKESIQLYRLVNNSREPADISVYKDNNKDGNIDYIEWIIPHLSSQTYIIEISKALHLDSNRDFIENIYDKVKSKDNIWHNVNDSEFVRVVFEKNLTNKNDITLYPRIISGTPSIEVYEMDGTELIAEFSSLNSDIYNKVYLTDLISRSQDIFDLRIVGGTVEIDHIIDPSSTYDYNSGQGTLHFVYVSPTGVFPPSATDGWAGTEIGSYTNVQDDNGGYITQVGGSNTEPYFRFNFTIAETPANINWIFVHINGFSTYDSGEDALCYVHNFITPAWESIGQLPTTDGNVDFNITTSITNYISTTAQLVYLCIGKNLEAVDEVSIDYIQVTVDYTDTETDAPSFSGPINNTGNTTKNTFASMNVTIEDNTALANYTFSTNMSGSWVNITSVQLGAETSVLANISLTITADEGTVFSWRYYANDTLGNSNESGLYNITVFSDNPRFLNAVNNTGNTTRNTFASMNVTIEDFAEIETITFSWNGTGNWVNDTAITLGNNSKFILANISKTITANESDIISWRWYSCDSSSNCNESGLYNITVYRKNPTFTNPLNGSGIGSGDEIGINITIRDAGALANYTFSWNDTGSWVNDTTIQVTNETSVFANVTKTITASASTIVSWRFYACDNSTFCNESGLYNFTVAEAASESFVPNWTNSQNNNTEPRFNQTVNLTVNWTDETQLAGFIFSTNISGSWVNDTPVEMGGTANFSYKLYTVGEPNGTIFTYRFYANDTSNNFNVTNNFSFTVQNTRPETPVNLDPLDASSTTNRTSEFGWTNKTDADNDTTYYDWFLDDNADFTTPESRLLNFTNRTLPNNLLDVDTTHYWFVRAYDGANYSDNSTTFTVTIDSSVVISVVNNSVNFTNLTNNQIDDTTDQLPDPFVVENDGNTFLDVNLTANKSLWDSAGLSTQYFQARAAKNTAEEGAFNFSNSITDWFNIPDSNFTLISQLDFNSTNDSAIIDLRIQVPPDEEPGDKYSGIIFFGYKTI